MRFIIEPTLPDGSENEIYREWRPVFGETGLMQLHFTACVASGDEHMIESDPDYVPSGSISDISYGSSPTHAALVEELTALVDAAPNETESGEDWVEDEEDEEENDDEEDEESDAFDEEEQESANSSDEML